MTLESPKRFAVSSLALAGLVFGLAMTIFLRVLNIDGMAELTFLDVFLWQVLSWLPWVAILFSLEVFLSEKIKKMVRNLHAANHFLFALAFGFLMTFWFKIISENLSPFLYLEETRFGVFPWFFIFWFFIQVILYGLVFSFYSLSPFGGARGTKKGKPRKLVVKKGKTSEVVDPGDVFWIEAQDYYSVLHLKDRQAWVKMTMQDLEKSLDPETFVRVHRSTIINVNFLDGLERGESGKYFALLQDKSRRPISRKGWRLLKPLLKTTRA